MKWIVWVWVSVSVSAVYQIRRMEQTFYCHNFKIVTTIAIAIARDSNYMIEKRKRKKKEVVTTLASFWKTVIEIIMEIVPFPPFVLFL